VAASQLRAAGAPMFTGRVWREKVSPIRAAQASRTCGVASVLPLSSTSTRARPPPLVARSEAARLASVASRSAALFQV
jgi:hypothetical protein